MTPDTDRRRKIAHSAFWYKEESEAKQVMLGHNIVVDGWAGASNAHPHLKSPTHIHKIHLKHSFSHFLTCVQWILFTDQQTNGPTDRRTDKVFYRVVCPQLEKKKQARNKQTVNIFLGGRYYFRAYKRQNKRKMVNDVGVTTVKSHTRIKARTDTHKDLNRG